MNRPMLILVGLLVLAGLIVFFVSGPSLTDRIDSARSCSELLATLDDVRDTGSESVQDDYTRRANELNCGG